MHAFIFARFIVREDTEIARMPSTLKHVACAVASLFAFAGAVAAQTAAASDEVPPMKSSAFSQKPLLCGAHRGGRSLWPENTVFAYTSAAAAYPDILLGRRAAHGRQKGCGAP